MSAIKKHRFTAERVMYFFMGNLLYAFAVRLFFVENNIIAGGFVGIATIINYLLPINVGAITFIMTMPFLLIAAFTKGIKFTLITMSASLVYSVIVDMLTFLPTITNNLLLASLFGGVLYSLGAVCMLNARASTGGTDLVSKLLLLKFRHLSLGKMYLIVDGLSILVAMIVFNDIEIGLYGILAIYICAVFTDKFITGFNTANICYIITKKEPQDMANYIMLKVNRGVTWQKAVGMYEMTEKNLLMVVVKPKEMYKLKDIIVEYDPTSFVVVAHANEVMGSGFHRTYSV